jgi:hypothetical protein
MYRIPIVAPQPGPLDRLISGFGAGLNIANELQKTALARQQQAYAQQQQAYQAQLQPIQLASAQQALQFNSQLNPLKLQEAQSQIDSGPYKRAVEQAQLQNILAQIGLRNQQTKNLALGGKNGSGVNIAISPLTGLPIALPGAAPPQASTPATQGDQPPAAQQTTIPETADDQTADSDALVDQTAAANQAAQEAAQSQGSQQASSPQQAVQAPQVTQGQPSATPAAAQSQGVMMPGEVGKTSRGQIAQWTNPNTGETLSALTATGRTQMQGMLRAMDQALPSLSVLAKTGSVGTLGPPSVLGQTLTQAGSGAAGQSLPGLGSGDPVSAAIYNSTLPFLQDVYVPARGLKGTVPQLTAVKKTLERQEWETGPNYENRINGMVNQMQGERQQIINALRAGGTHVPGFAEQQAMNNPAGASQSSSMKLPSFNTKDDFVKWASQQSPQVLAQYKSQLGG